MNDKCYKLYGSIGGLAHTTHVAFLAAERCDKHATDVISVHPDCLMLLHEFAGSKGPWLCIHYTTSHVCGDISISGHIRSS